MSWVAVLLSVAPIQLQLNVSSLVFGEWSAKPEVGHKRASRKLARLVSASRPV